MLSRVGRLNDREKIQVAPGKIFQDVLSRLYSGRQKLLGERWEVPGACWKAVPEQNTPTQCTEARA